MAPTRHTLHKDKALSHTVLNLSCTWLDITLQTIKLQLTLGTDNAESSIIDLDLFILRDQLLVCHVIPLNLFENTININRTIIFLHYEIYSRV